MRQAIIDCIASVNFLFVKKLILKPGCILLRAGHPACNIIFIEITFIAKLPVKSAGFSFHRTVAGAKKRTVDNISKVPAV